MWSMMISLGLRQTQQATQQPPPSALVETQPQPSFLSRLQSTFLLAFVVASPLLIYGIDSDTGFSLRFSRMILMAAIASIMIRGAWYRDLKLTWTRTDSFLAAYVILCLISGLVLTPFANFKTRFFGLVECLAIFYAVRLWLSEHRAYDKLIAFFLLGTGLVLIEGMYELWKINLEQFNGPLFGNWILNKYERLTTPITWGPDGPLTRIASTLGEPNMTGGALAASLPLTSYFLVNAISVGKRWAIAPLTLLLMTISAGIIATGSKSALLSACIGFGIFLRGTMKQSRSSPKIRLAILMILGVICLSGAFYAAAHIEMLALRVSSLDNGHLRHRMTAFAAYLKQPFFGTGYANFGSTHTVLLTALVETGIAGGLLIIALFFGPFQQWRSAIKLRLWKDLGHQHLGRAVMSSFASIVVGLYLYDYLLYPFTWIIFAMSVEYLAQLNTQQPGVPTGANPSS